MKTFPTVTRAAFVFLAFVTVAEARIKTQAVEYQDGDTVLEGYLAYDDAKSFARKPGVLIVHAWKGITAYEKSRAEQIARLGYVAFVADIYGKGIRPQTSDEARKLAGQYKGDLPLLRKRVNLGLEELKKQRGVAPNRIGAMGYCFGGTTVLELARSGADLSGVVSFHGGLATKNTDESKNIKGKVLVLTGADDPGVPPSQVAAFEEEMRKGGVDYQVVSYGGAVHSFTDPGAGNDNSTGSAYNAKADKRSFEMMKDFFAEALTPKP
jgi:dienelactone hydrolase